MCPIFEVTAITLTNSAFHGIIFCSYLGGTMIKLRTYLALIFLLPATAEAPEESTQIEVTIANGTETKIDRFRPAPVTTCPRSLEMLPATYRDKAKQDERLIVVFKRLYKVALYKDGNIMLKNGSPACFPIGMGNWPYEPKFEYDNASTPEGWYTVAHKRTADPNDQWMRTSYQYALHVSYPNAMDVGRAEARGVITNTEAQTILADISRGILPSQTTAMGGQILLHTDLLWDDGVSTAGCVGVADTNMEWLFKHSKEGDQILLLPWKEVLLAGGTSRIDATIPKAPEPSYGLLGAFNWNNVDVEASRTRGIITMKPIYVTGISK